jgi:hypothetical protein
MTDEAFHQSWHQVRVFTKNFVSGRYPELLGNTVAPLLIAKPNVSLFFSYYVSPLAGQYADNADTDIAALPTEFLFQLPPHGQCHCSLRIRFRETRGVRRRLRQLIEGEPNFWFSRIDPCTLPDVLDPLRFSTLQDHVPKLRRIRRVTELLCANSRTIVDTLTQQAGVWIFEQNNHGLNEIIGTVGQSILHMVVNPWSRNDSNPLPMFWRGANNQPVPLSVQ